MGVHPRHEVGRNEPCSCGSGLKAKYCHQDPGKIAVCNRIVNEKMVQLIYQEKIRKGLMCEHGVPKNEHCKDCEIGD